MRCDRNPRIIFPMKQENVPYSCDEEGNLRLFLSCGGTLGVPLKWRWVCRGNSLLASRVSRTLSRLKREGGISLQTLQPKRASSRVEGKIAWFFSSCGRKFRVFLELQWGHQGPACVASGKSSLHVSCEGPLWIPLQSLRVLGPHLELRPEPQDSSPVLTGILVFLWSFSKGLRPHLVWRQCKSTFFSSCNSSVRLLES